MRTSSFINRWTPVVVAVFAATTASVARGADERQPPLAGGPREYRADWFDPDAKATGPGPLQSALDEAGLGEGLRSLRLDVRGHAEVGYTFNPDHDTGDDNFGRVFDDEHGHHVQIDQLDLAVERRARRLRGRWDVGGALEVVYGYDTFRFHSGGLDFYSGCEDEDAEDAGHDGDRDPLLQFDLLQAYADVNVPVGRGLVLRVGKFVTPLGYETIDPATSPLYSRSYLFGFAKPFTHTGVLANYRFDDAWQAWGGVVRGWDQATEDDNDVVSFVGRVDYAPGPRWETHFGFVTGPEGDDCDCDCPSNNERYRTVVDLTAGYVVNEKLKLGAEALYGYDGAADGNGNAADWYGAAGYAAYRFDRRVTLNGRLEGFYDGDGTRLDTGEDLTLYSATVGLTVTPFPGHAFGSHVRVRPEIRYDHADAPEFDGGTSKNQLTAGVDVVVTF